MSIKDHPIFRSLFKKEYYVIDLYHSPSWMKSDKFTVKKEWRKVRKEDLYAEGYLKCVDLLTGWEHLFTKAFIRFHDFRVFSVKAWNKSQTDPDMMLPEDTSYTQDDFFRSSAKKKFLAGMTRMALLNGVDGKIIGIAVIGLIGAGIALYMIMHGVS